MEPTVEDRTVLGFIAYATGCDGHRRLADC